MKMNLSNILQNISSIISNDPHMIKDTTLLLNSLTCLGANRSVLFLLKKRYQSFAQLLELFTLVSDYILNKVEEPNKTLKDYNVDDFNTIMIFINSINKPTQNSPIVYDLKEDYGALCLKMSVVIANLKNSNADNWTDYAMDLYKLTQKILDHYNINPGFIKLYRNSIRIILDAITWALDKYGTQLDKLGINDLIEYNLISTRYVEIYYTVCDSFELTGYPFDDFLSVLLDHRIKICDLLKIHPSVTEQEAASMERDSIIFTNNRKILSKETDRKTANEIILNQIDKLSPKITQHEGTLIIKRSLQLQCLCDKIRTWELHIGIIDNERYNTIMGWIQELTQIVNNMTIQEFVPQTCGIDIASDKYKKYDEMIYIINKWIQMQLGYLKNLDRSVKVTLHHKFMKKVLCCYLQFFVALVGKMPANITRIATIEPHRYVKHLNWIESLINIPRKTTTITGNEHDYDYDYEKIFMELIEEANIQITQINESKIEFIASGNNNNDRDSDSESKNDVDTTNKLSIDNPLQIQYKEAAALIKTDTYAAEILYRKIIDAATTENNPIMVVDCLAELVTCYMQRAKYKFELHVVEKAIQYAHDAIEYYKTHLAPLLDTGGVDLKEIQKRSELVYFQLHNSKEWFNNICEYEKLRLDKLAKLKQKIEQGRLEAMKKMQDRWFSNPNPKNKYAKIIAQINEQLKFDYEKISIIEEKYITIYQDFHRLHSGDHFADQISELSKIITSYL